MIGDTLYSTSTLPCICMYSRRVLITMLDVLKIGEMGMSASDPFWVFMRFSGSLC